MTALGHMLQRDLSIRLFGPVEVEAGDRRLGPRDLGGNRPKQVLELLLLARGHRVPTDRLAELLWGDDLPGNAAGSLQTFVSVLRRRLHPDRDRARELVVTEPEAYRVATDAIELDLDRFDELVDRSSREPTRLARRSLEEAIQLARGDVLEDEPYAAWAQDTRRTYQGRLLGARLEAADVALAELDFAAALAHAQAAAGLDAFAERAFRATMLAQYALERQHDALETYRGFRERLAGELGLEPTAETRALEAAILRQEDVHALLPRAIRRDAANEARPPSVRLLGRATELATLDDAAHRALDGEAVLLLVEGEAGLGKTRLLEELATGLRGVRVGRASCTRLERHLSYVPLAAALRDALEGVELDAHRRPALARVLPELQPGGQPLEADELDVLEAVVELVVEHAPLALVLDDAHWADPATVSTLSYLRRRCAGAPLVLAASIGSEHAAPDSCIRHLEPDVHVRLGPLTASDLAPLGRPGLHAATGGNPRFVTEAIARPTGHGLSDDLANALVATCRAEGPAAFRILVAASVVEQPFAPEPLAALLHADPAELVEELERLCERRLLRVDGPRFRFRYGIVREALLASLSPARKRLLRDRLPEVDGMPAPAPYTTELLGRR